MKWKRMRDQRKRIASVHVERLLELSLQSLGEHPERSRRYVELARNIIRKHKVRLSVSQKMMFCKQCNTPLVPGSTSRVRTSGGKVSITCLACGSVKRYPFAKERRLNKTTVSKSEKKYPGGLVQATVRHRGTHIVSVKITGDFFFYPEEKLACLERELSGRSVDDIEGTIISFFEREGIATPGVEPKDFGEVICLAARD